MSIGKMIIHTGGFSDILLSDNHIGLVLFIYILSVVLDNGWGTKTDLPENLRDHPQLLIHIFYGSIP